MAATVPCGPQKQKGPGGRCAPAALAYRSAVTVGQTCDESGAAGFFRPAVPKDGGGAGPRGRHHPAMLSPVSHAFLPSGPRLNLGCGPVQPAGWVNIDGSNRARLASRLAPLDRMLVRLGILSPTEFGPTVKICNLRKRLPYRDGSVAAIYSSEVWEHFTYEDALRLTRECFRVLAPGGVLRVCVPDGVAFWREYVQLHDAQMAAAPGSRSAALLRAHVQSYFRCICTKRIWLGSLGHLHKWQFDEIQLVDMFEQAGFINVARAPYHESRIPGIEKIECYDFLIVEGVKPA
jgi:predicted SAM-dependent methyltransferase